MMAAGSLAQPVQSSLMTSERALALVTTRPPFIVLLYAHRATAAAPMRPMLPRAAIMVPGIALSGNGTAHVDWSSRGNPIRLAASPIDDPTSEIASALRPHRIDPFPMFGAGILSAPTPSDRLPSTAPSPSPLAPAPSTAGVLSVIDITPMLRISLAAASPRSLGLSVPEIGAPDSAVRPSW